MAGTSTTTWISHCHRSLDSALRPHGPRTAPARDLAALERTVEVDHKGNFGKLTHETEQTNLRWIDKGRSSNESRSAYTGPDGSKHHGARRAVSLCGLVEVLAEQGGEGSNRLTTVVTAGGVAHAIDFAASTQILMRYRLRSFASSVPNICMPSPGMVFTYRFTAELQRRITPSAFRKNMLIDVSEP